MKKSPEIDFLNKFLITFLMKPNNFLYNESYKFVTLYHRLKFMAPLLCNYIFSFFLSFFLSFF